MVARSRHFCFTWNNYDDAAVISRFLVLKPKTKYVLYGREVGDSGTPHLQGLIIFKDACTETACRRRLPGCHVEICADIDASIVYCMKDGDYTEEGVYMNRSQAMRTVVEKRIDKNRILAAGSIVDLVADGSIAITQVPMLYKAQMILRQMLPAYEHDDVRGEWYYGEPRSGKSRTAREKYPSAYIKAQNKWFDGYSGQKEIILDDLDTEVMGHYIKIWTDRYSFMGETKNGHVQTQHHVFCITSNYSPEQLFKDPVMALAIRERCKVTKFSKNPYNTSSIILIE